MVTYIFRSLADRAESKQIDQSKVTDARDWFREEASKIRTVKDNQIIDPKNIVTSLTTKNIGQMFMFFYAPKHAKTLPYYDRFPLVFPIEFYSNGFLGINLHYLPRKFRAMLMDALYMTLNNNKNDKTTRLRISYEVLSSSIRMRYFRPCVKRYLFDNVLQKFLYIDPNDWDKCLMLPTERFVKKNTSYVHMISSRQIREVM